ncbi:hypothetical protein PInf_004785 [Phytophthora infestans]|nr:hypothetical protein PInf_004785 [Phytophthora infestans]
MLVQGPDNFRVMWTGLKAMRWTAKPPSSRSLKQYWKYTCIKPDGDPGEKEGEDYFLGEQALFNYSGEEDDESKEEHPTVLLDF